jgi:hypothetical protein
VAIRQLPSDEFATAAEDAGCRFAYWVFSPVLAPAVLAAAFTHYVLTPRENDR